MREHPILFSAPMIRALLADRKFVTRRLSKQWLKVNAGDRLWVREAFAEFYASSRLVKDSMLHEAGIRYAADGGERMLQVDHQRFGGSLRHNGDLAWKPSIHMPRWASRILLECEEDARLERLQEISHTEIEAEGLELIGNYRAHFRDLWSTLHTKPGERWEDNPELVRVGRFRRIA